MTYILTDEERKVWACRSYDPDAHLALLEARYPPKRVAEMVQEQLAAARPLYEACVASGVYRTYKEIKAERDARNAAYDKAGTDAFRVKYDTVKAAGLADAGTNEAKLAILEVAALHAARTADATARAAWRKANPA